MKITAEDARETAQTFLNMKEAFPVLTSKDTLSNTIDHLDKRIDYLSSIGQFTCHYTIKDTPENIIALIQDYRRRKFTVTLHQISEDKVGIKFSWENVESE